VWGGAALHRAKSDSQLPQLATKDSSRASSESEEAKPVVVAEDLEDLLRQSMPKSPPTQPTSFADGEQRPVTFRDPRALRQVATRSAQHTVRSCPCEHSGRVGACRRERCVLGSCLPGATSSQNAGFWCSA
jgi:hypothetical protein